MWLSNIKKNLEQSTDGDVDLVADNYPEILSISSEMTSKEWILNSSCSFHICSMKNWFENLKVSNGGKELLEDNFECKIRGIGMVRLKLNKDSEKILSDVRYVLKIKNKKTLLY